MQNHQFFNTCPSLTGDCEQRGPAASTALKTSSLLRGWQAAAHTVGGTLETLIMAASSVTRDLRVAAPVELSPAVGACRGLRSLRRR